MVVVVRAGNACVDLTRLDLPYFKIPINVLEQCWRIFFIILMCVVYSLTFQTFDESDVSLNSVSVLLYFLPK